MKVNISPELNSRTTQYAIVQPSGVLSADKYQQQLGDIRIGQVDISGTRTTTSPIYRSFAQWSADAANAAFLFLVLDVQHHYPGFDERHQQIAESRFSFDVEQAGEVLHSECRRLSVATQTVYERDNTGDAISTSTAREQSTLGCVLTEQGQVSELLVDTSRGNMARMRLRHGPQTVQLKPLTGVQMLVGGAWQSMPEYRPATLDGISFAADGIEQSAVSLFGGKNKIWLDKTVTPQRQRLLVAASYSLILYSWQDDTWLMDAAPDTAGAAQNPAPWH